jgi:hypothetical protein
MAGKSRPEDVAASGTLAISARGGSRGETAAMGLIFTVCEA